MGSVRAGRAAVSLLLMGALLGACSDEPGPAAPSASGTATAPPAPLPAGPTPTGAPMEGDLGSATGAPAPVWDEGSRADATATATAAMTAYARPTLDPDTWWGEFSAFLSPAAQQDYQWVQPASIAATALGPGPAALVDESSVYLARVEVPTDAGTYRVLLSRQDGPTPWLVERVEPPEGVA